MSIFKEFKHYLCPICFNLPFSFFSSPKNLSIQENKKFYLIKKACCYVILFKQTKIAIS